MRKGKAVAGLRDDKASQVRWAKLVLLGAFLFASPYLDWGANLEELTPLLQVVALAIAKL